MEQLVEKTKPAQFADRNPHRSHLGEIACTVCHKAHEASVVYCLDCHRKFEMKIVGGDEELIAHVRGLIATFKAPRDVHFVEELPKTATGKVQKFVLRAGKAAISRQ